MLFHERLGSNAPDVSFDIVTKYLLPAFPKPSDFLTNQEEVFEDSDDEAMGPQQIQQMIQNREAPPEPMEVDPQIYEDVFGGEWPHVEVFDAFAGMLSP